MKNFFVRDRGYEETLPKGLLAARTLGRTLSRGRGTKKECIDRLRKDIDGADAIVLGAGAGLSTSTELTYRGERFHKYFFDFEETYGIEDMYAGGFYPFPEEEIQWDWWARHSYFNRS